MNPGRRLDAAREGRKSTVRVGGRSAAILRLVVVAVPLVATATAFAAPAWQLLDDGEPTRGAWKLVYDTARQRPVMLVDTGANTLDFPQGQHPGNTWELVDGFWKRIFIPEPVPWVAMGCAAYDDVRDVMVVFGTWTSNETWEYDGTTWTKRTLPTSPPPRNRCGMVYDASRGKIVMFGGEDANFQPKGDHWEYDGTNWTQRTFNTIPSSRTEPAMAYDSTRGVTVLFGGMIPLVGQGYSDTWEFDGTRWRQKNPNTVPPRRAGAGMAYDPIRARTVMFGGYTPTTPYADTWEWNGTNWLQKFPASSPDARRRAATIWDPSRGRVLIFGGEPPDTKRNDTWTYDGVSWTKTADEDLPVVRGSHALTFDPLHGRLVLYGGKDYDPDPGTVGYLDTWFHDGNAWTQVVGAGTPASPTFPMTVFDSERGTVRGWSGSLFAANQFPTDVYELQGEPPQWASLAYCCPEPAGRVYPMLASAPGLGGLYVYGGQLANGDPSEECWVLRGAVWTECTSSPSPGAVQDGAVTYDSQRNRLILHGGHPFSQVDSPSTWSFDGTSWILLVSSSAPGGRSRHSLAYDAARDRVVLFGDGAPTEHSTWEFDGAQWSAIATPRMPDATRCDSELTYDPVHQVVWLFGGVRCAGSGGFNDTWAYGEDDDADGKVGGLDNCRQVANPNQSNGDGDPAGDVCDCAPVDATAFAVPANVGGLFASGSGTTSLTWADQSSTAGSGTRYDVAKGTLAELRSGSVGSAGCLASQLAVASASDGAVPSPGDGFWYLVRARNACGIGTFGSGAVDAAAPCP